MRDTLDGLPEITPAHLALVALALTLARKLDEGAGLATAAVGRELRATLDVLTKGDGDDADDEFTGFIASLSAPMGDTPFS